MWEFFLALVVVGLFGSISLFTPNITWNDPTIIFRKNQEAYRRFSNRFMGKYWLSVAAVSFVLLLLSILDVINIPPLLIGICYLGSTLVAFITLHFKWKKAS